ncbi:MAG: VOC family protein [Acidimicrobiales bacterium]
MHVDFDHVAVALEQWRDGWPLFAGALGGSWVSGGLGPGFSPSQLRYANDMRLELLAPNRVDLNDFLRRFLDRSGPGPHHLTFKVPDLGQALEVATAAGYQPIGVDTSDPEWHEAFLHPKQATGVVVQLAAALGGSWSEPPPEGFPSADPVQRASLRRVVHAVADLDEGLRLFGGLLGGSPSPAARASTAPAARRPPTDGSTWPGPVREG